MNDMLLLAGAGFVAGAMNALAGGGSFVSLPAMIAVGVPSVVANSSSTIALFPGGVASAWVYRGSLERVAGIPVRTALAITLVGGLVGSLLLLWTPSASFDRVLPWLLLTATIVLASGPRLGPWLRARFRAPLGVVLVVQFMLGIYGGYFGGAVGLMMVATWCLLDEADIKALNGPRTLMVTAANSIAVICFILAGAVRWPETLVLGAGAIVGGYGGARLGRVLPPAAVRAATLLVAAGMTAAFFLRAYVRG